ncbi:ABC transporter ATP-binding protein [Streptomyces cavernae]|uniref:ABC transporter ATP-binding protein n=1 Tax=Streptomyces cavernae TaxID=2259034 RepID=UPI0013920F90|nr:ABC transporter ATP-binding protein [Streptomyces cavernae]
MPRLLTRFRARTALSVLLIAVNAGTVVVPAFLAQRIIDEGVLAGDRTRLWGLSAALFAAGLLAAGSALGERWLVTRLAEDVTARVRCDMFSHLQRQSAAFFSGARSGAIVSRLHGDVHGVRDLIARTLRTTVSSLLTLSVGVIALLLLDWRIALAAVAVTPVVYVLTLRSARILPGIARNVLTATADVDSLAAEGLSAAGAETIRLYGAASRTNDRFRRAAMRVRDTTVRGMLLDARLGAALAVVTTSATAAVYVTAGAMVIGGDMTVGTMIAMASLLTVLYGPITALPGCRLELVRGLVSFERIREVMLFEPAISDRPGARTATGRGVTFTNVSFAYPPQETTAPASLQSAREPGEQTGTSGGPPRDVLKRVTFTAEPGTTVGIVGGSGSGKSTLTRLLTRCWESTGGRVEIGGQDVHDLTLHSLHQHIGVVTQEPFLFHGTIRDNLLMARADADDARLLAACETAQIRDLIEQLPDGLGTVLGDRGVQLSGGERQRLAIARMLLKEPEIVVLDEATSHLDNATEHRLQTALQPFLRERTCLIVAHRLSTVRQADLLLLLDDGEITERGTHVELMGRDGPYRRLLNARSLDTRSGNITPMSPASSPGPTTAARASGSDASG